METNYVERARKMNWRQLNTLWKHIRRGDTPSWPAGRAFEHLVVRGLELSGLEVEYGFNVPPTGRPIEQIDGAVYHNELVFLIECKDREINDIDVVAKVRYQLERRPPTVFGCIFVAGAYTRPALDLTDMTPPQRTLLWQEDDIITALEQQDFSEVLLRKYRNLCSFGMTDYAHLYQIMEAS